jgi:hypothetical protein
VQICKDHQYFKEVPVEELKQIIAQHIAGDPRQITLYIARLESFKFMKQLNPHVMEIQPAQIQKPVEHLDEVILNQYGIKVTEKD